MAKTPERKQPTKPAAGRKGRAHTVAVARETIAKAPAALLRKPANEPTPEDAPLLGDRQEALASLSLDKLEEIILTPCGPNDEKLRKDQVAASQIVLNTQVRVDENRLKQQQAPGPAVDYMAEIAKLRADNPRIANRPHRQLPHAPVPSND